MNTTTSGMDFKVPLGNYRHSLYVYPLIAIVILITNVMVVVVIVRYKCFHTPSNMFILNTAVADILTAVVTIPLLILYYENEINEHLCVVSFALILAPLSASIWAVFLISIDRFFCIVRPFLYQRWMTTTKAGILSVVFILCSFMASCILLLQPAEPTWKGCISLVFHSGCTTYIVVTYGAVLTTMTALYMIVCKIAWDQRKRIRASPCSNTNEAQSPDNDHKIRNMMLLVLGIFYISWIPQITLMLWGFFVHQPNHITKTLEPVCEILYLSNSFMNPFVYAFKSRQYKAGFKTLLRVNLKSEDIEVLSL